MEDLAGGKPSGHAIGARKGKKTLGTRATTWEKWKGQLESLGKHRGIVHGVDHEVLTMARKSEENYQRKDGCY